MRKLQTPDIFSFCRLVTEMNVKEDIKKIVTKAANGKSTNQELGFDILFLIFERATQKNTEEKLYEFAAGIFEEDVEIVRTMDPVEFIDKLMEAADPEKWKAFFTRVVALMRRS